MNKQKFMVLVTGCGLIKTVHWTGAPFIQLDFIPADKANEAKHFSSAGEVETVLNNLLQNKKLITLIPVEPVETNEGD